MDILTVGSLVSVHIDSRMTSAGALCMAAIRFEIAGETAKAWKVEAETEAGNTITAWLPKKALNRVERIGTVGNHPQFSARLATWFIPTGWTAVFLRKATDVTTLAAG